MTELGLNWVRIRSWHLVDSEATVAGAPVGYRTYCKLLAPVQEPQAFPPPNTATCETCFQRRERRAG